MSFTRRDAMSCLRASARSGTRIGVLRAARRVRGRVRQPRRVNDCRRCDAKSSSVDAPHGLRILSLAPNLTEIAFAAGAGPLPGRHRRVQRLSGGGDASCRAWATRGASTCERVLALRPDVVLVWPTGTPERRSRSLRAARAQRRRGAHVEPRGRAARTAPASAALAGTRSVAERAARDFEHALRSSARNTHRPPLSVFIQIDDEPIYTVNGRT